MKRARQHSYEGLYIFRPTLSDEAREKAIKKTIGVVESLGGSHKKTINWGRKKMAYDIKGCREGHYILIYFSLPTAEMHELIRENHLHEDLLRYYHKKVEAIPEADEITFKPLSPVER